MSLPAPPGRRVALITGGCGAIGRALITRLQAAGYLTVALDLPDALPDPDAGNARADGAEDLVGADITDPDDVAKAIAGILERHGRLDLLINNAGVTALGTLETTPPDVFEQVMAVNLHGAVHCTQAALPALEAARGRVVAMSSVAGFAPVIGRPAYVASKHAVTGLFRSLRPELATRGIGVTVVHPTFVRTPLRDTAATGRPDGAGRATTGEMLEPDEVAFHVVRGIVRGKDQVLIGRTAKLAYHVSRLAPRLYERLMARRLT